MQTPTRRYFLLKIITNFLTLIWGFLQTYVFVRVFSHRDFSIIIVIYNVAGLLMFLDFGLSKIFFVDIRSKFVGGDRSEHTRRVASLLLLYGLVLAAGAAGIAGYMALTTSTTAVSPLLGSIYFVVVAANLPWLLLQNVSNAIDRFIRFEMLDVARRTLQVLLLMTLLIFDAALPVFLAILAVWVASFALTLFWLQRDGVVRRTLVHPFAWYGTLSRRDRLAAVQSAVFIGSEAALYQAPLLAVPIFYGLGPPVIIADTLFKVFRGAVSLFRVSSETLAPQQTAAFFGGKPQELRRRTLQVLVISSIFAVPIVGGLLLFGQRIFAILLNTPDLISPAAILCLIVLIAGNIVQNTFGSLLLNTGFFADLAKMGIVVLFLVAVTVTVGGVTMPTVVAFLFVYAGCYAISAAAYSWLGFRRLLAKGGAAAAGGR